MEKNGEYFKKLRIYPFLWASKEFKRAMSEIVRDKIFYAGAFDRPLDDKRRLTIPAKWRFKNDDDDSSYLAIPNTYGSISVLPPAMAERLYETISKISIANPAKRRAVSMLLEKSSTFGCDKQGRIMLDETLLSHAGISKEVRVIGMGPTFEIWSSERRKDWVSGEDASDTDISTTLEELGI